MRADAKRSRPGGQSQAARADSATTKISKSILPAAPHILAHDDVVTLSEKAVTHAHAVLVCTPGGRWSRRLFLSLHAADKAMQRARERGLPASCVMVELVPVPGVPVVVVGGDER